MSRRSKKGVITMIISSIITCATIYCISRPNSYAVSINDKVIGYIATDQNIADIYPDSEEAILKQEAIQVVSLTPVTVDKKYVASADTIKDSISHHMNTLTPAIELKFGEAVVGRVLKESDIEYILSKITQYYKNNSSLQNATVVQTVHNLDKKLTTTTFASIDSNDDIIRHIISQNSINDTPLVEVHLLDLQENEKKIPYSQEVRWDDSLVLGDSKVEIEGIEGLSTVKEEVKIVNNKIIDRKDLEVEVVSEPTQEVILKGNLMDQNIVTLNIPSRGVLTSSYGPRWGTLHKGIDIGAPIGDPIYAAMDGVVEYSGYEGTYGYVVKLKHGDNVMTVYAHCSKLLVEAGDTVSKGEKIAEIGSTGQSTGPHLHFEVRVNGVQVDPATFKYN